MKFKKLKVKRGSYSSLRVIVIPMMFLIFLSLGQMAANSLGMQLLEITFEPPVTVVNIIGVFLACWILILLVNLLIDYFPFDKFVEWVD